MLTILYPLIAILSSWVVAGSGTSYTWDLKTTVREIQTKSPTEKGKIYVYYVVSRPLCESCLSEIRYGWSTMPAAIRKHLSIFLVTNDVRKTDLVDYRLPIIEFTSSTFDEDTRNHVIIAENTGEILSTYHIGSQNGFDPSYRLVDSLLLCRAFFMKGFSTTSSVDSMGTSYSIHLERNNPLFTHFSYNSKLERIEIVDINKSKFLVLDTNGDRVRESSLPTLRSRSDTSLLDIPIFGAMSDLWQPVVAYLQFYDSKDSVIYGQRVRSFSKNRQVIKSPWRGKSDSVLILPDKHGNFIESSSDTRHLWIFDNKSAVTCDTDIARLLIINLETFAMDSLALPVAKKPIMYFVTHSGNSLYILPDSGQMVRIDTDGRITRQIITCRLPGYRMCTYTSGENILGVVQKINDHNYAIFFDREGRRISDPVSLPNENSYAILLDSGDILIIASGSQDNLFFYRVHPSS